MTTAVATDRPGPSSDSGYGNSDAPTSVLGRNATDDEILGLGVRERSRDRFARSQEAAPTEKRAADASPTKVVTENSPLADFKEMFDAKPELEKAWTEATSYRESFATPDDARLAATQLADVAAMDALFFSAKADDQVKLARLAAGINPDAFQLLASAMAQVAAEGRQPAQAQSNPAFGKGEQRTDENPVQQSQHKSTDVAGTRERFLQETNAAAVEHIVSAIEGQVDRLLPANISKNARNRTVAEIYREVDSALQQNGELESQLRLALRSGNLDPRHRDAIASLVVN